MFVTVTKQFCSIRLWLSIIIAAATVSATARTEVLYENHDTHIQSSVLDITNGLLTVSYDQSTNKFTVAASNVFLREGQFVDTSGASSIVSMTDSTFGSGQGIKITYSNGNIDYVALYPDIPFAFFKSVKNNPGSTAVILNQVNTVSACVDIGIMYNSLKAFGTGGLKSPDNNPGSYVFLATVDPSSRKGVVSGWLTHDRGSGVIFTTISNNMVRIVPRLDYGTLRLAANSIAETEMFLMGYFDDARFGLEKFADMLAQVYKIHLPAQPSGYCTWYSDSHGSSSDETYLPQIVDYAAQNLALYGFNFVQIDDNWQAGVEGNGPTKVFIDYNHSGPYKSGMKAIADKVRAKGLTPGLWFMPFAGNYKDPYFSSHQDWFVKKSDGTPYEQSWGGTSLDMTVPSVRQYVATIVNQIANTWGFKYFKMDGLYTGGAIQPVYVNDSYKVDNFGDAVFSDPSKTNVEVYRDGMKLVRQNAGNDVFFLGCNMAQNMRTFGASIGLFDAMRIGPDNKATDWNYLTRGPKSGTRFYFLNGRVWYNDPDPEFVRNTLVTNQARYICSWVGLTGQLTVNSDWLPNINSERLTMLRRTIPAHGLKPRPSDYFDQDIPRIWLLTDTSKETRRDVIGLFNHTTSEITITESLQRIGLSADTYEAFDYWNNNLLDPLSGAMTIKVPGQDARLIAVRPVSQYPQVLSTSRHVSQGMIDILQEAWSSSDSTLRGVSQVVGGDPYELRIVARLQSVTSVEVSLVDQTAGFSISYVQSGALVRITVQSSQSRTVAWSVHFNNVMPTDVKGGTLNSLTPSEFELFQNFPNPFNPTTEIRYDLPEASHVELIVYDIGGKAVETLINKDQKAGFYRCTWNASNYYGSQAASGTYLAHLTAGNFVKTIKMILVK